MRSLSAELLHLLLIWQVLARASAPLLERCQVRVLVRQRCSEQGQGTAPRLGRGQAL